MARKLGKTPSPTASVAETVSRNLERLRGKHGLTKAELAKRSGLHRVTVSHIEAARYKSVDGNSIQRLADALGEPVGELLAGAGAANATR